MDFLFSSVQLHYAINHPFFFSVEEENMVVIYKGKDRQETIQRLQQAGEEFLDEGLFGIRDQTVADLQQITDEEFENYQWTMTE